MTRPDKSEARRRVQQITQEHRAHGELNGWFETVYAGAGQNPDLIPWANLEPNPHLVEWLDHTCPEVSDRRAVVVGCGLGDDAEELARRGFTVTAFDLSPTAIAWCQRRFPNTSVRYLSADLFNLPNDWSFHLVAEIYTIQAIPLELRRTAISCVASLVAPGGQLLAIGRLVNSPDEQPEHSPVPLTGAEVGFFGESGLSQREFSDFWDDENPPVRRFRAVFNA